MNPVKGKKRKHENDKSSDSSRKKKKKRKVKNNEKQLKSETKDKVVDQTGQCDTLKNSKCESEEDSKESSKLSKKRKRRRRKARQVPDSSVNEFVNRWYNRGPKDDRERKGKWSPQETEILESNIRALEEENDLPKGSFKFHIYKDIHFKNGDILGWDTFVKRTDMYVKLVKGLWRNLGCVQDKLRRICEYKVGRYSLEEEEELRVLHALHGNKWTLISDKIGRSDRNIQVKWIRMAGARGSWTDTEMTKLEEAVRLLTRTEKGTATYKGIPWKVVADLVGSRNPNQCHHKWVKSPQLALNETKVIHWSMKDDLNLIKTIYNSSALEECQLDFSEMFDSWEGDSPISPQKLVAKWAVLKSKYFSADLLRSLSFEDVLDFLWDKVVPELEAQIEFKKKRVEEYKNAEKKKKNGKKKEKKELQ